MIFGQVIVVAACAGSLAAIHRTASWTQPAFHSHHSANLNVGPEDQIDLAGNYHICSNAVAQTAARVTNWGHLLSEQSSMSGYEVLGENEWKKRRTIADAIDVLQKWVGFEGDDRAEVQLGGLRLPSGDVVSLSRVSLESAAYRKTFFVQLPTATKFKALSKGELVIDDIGRLEGATLDEKGNVELQDGTSMRAVEIIPALLPYEVSALDRVIVALTIIQRDALDKCSYSSGRAFLDHPEDDPCVGLIDCSKLAGLNVPELKVIKGCIADCAPEFAAVSEQKISDTLKKFGMRIPSKRTRRT